MQQQALPPARAPGQARACPQSQTHPCLRQATQPARSAGHCWRCLRLPQRSCQPADPVKAQQQEITFLHHTQVAPGQAETYWSDKAVKHFRQMTRPAKNAFLWGLGIGSRVEPKP